MTTPTGKASANHPLEVLWIPDRPPAPLARPSPPASAASTASAGRGLVMGGGVFCGQAGSEDDHVMASPGLRQTPRGELMFIPKQHADELCDTPDELSGHMAVLANRLSRAIQSVFRPHRMGLVLHGFGVPHDHPMILPQREPSDIISGGHAQIEDGKIVCSAKGSPSGLARISTRWQCRYGSSKR